MTGHSCEQFEEHLSAYLDEELEENVAAKVTEHLQKCPRCRATLGDLQRVVSLVGRLPRGKAAPELSELVIARLERQQLYGGAGEVPKVSATPPGVLRFGRLIASAAVVLLTVLAAYLTIDLTHQARQPDLRVADAEKATEPTRAMHTNRDSAGPTTTAARPEAIAMAPRMMGKDTATHALAPGESMRFAKKATPPEDRPTTAAAPSSQEAEPRVAKPGAPVPASQPSSPPPALALALANAAGETKKARMDVGRAVTEPPAKAAPAKGAPAFEPSPQPANDTSSDRPEDSGHRATKAGTSTRPLAERLVGSMTVDELEQHPADAEPVQLVVTAEDAADQENVARQLRSFFARNAIVDARSLGTRAPVDTASNFYLAQTPSARPASEERFLFRGTPTQVSSLLDELSQSAPRNSQVVLMTPTLQAEGWERANIAAQMLREGQPRKAKFSGGSDRVGIAKGGALPGRERVESAQRQAAPAQQVVPDPATRSRWLNEPLGRQQVASASPMTEQAASPPVADRAAPGPPATLTEGPVLEVSRPAPGQARVAQETEPTERDGRAFTIRQARSDEGQIRGGFGGGVSPDQRPARQAIQAGSATPGDLAERQIAAAPQSQTVSSQPQTRAVPGPARAVSSRLQERALGRALSAARASKDQDTCVTVVITVQTPPKANGESPAGPQP